MHHALRHREALLRVELHPAAFELDYEFALDDVEELVLLVVLVPVEFALQHAHADHRVVDLA